MDPELDTTQPGVSAEQQPADASIQDQAQATEAPVETPADPPAEEQAPQRPLTPREEIYASARKRRRDELGLKEGPKPAEAAEQPQEAPQEGQEQPAAQERPRDAQGRFVPQDGGKGQQPKKAAATPEQADERKIRVKVNGVEMELPESEVVKGYQPVAAGQALLRQAAQRRAELERKERELAEMEARLKAGQAPQQADAGQQPKADTSGVDYEALVRQISMGSEKEAAEALRLAVEQAKGNTAEPIDPKKIAEQVMAEALPRMQAQQEYRRDVESFANEYSDIVSDEDARHLAARKVNQFRVAELAKITDIDWSAFRFDDPKHIEWLSEFYRTHATRGMVPSDLDLYRRAGDEVRSKFGLGRQQQTTPSDGGQQERPTITVERVVPKETLHQPPSGASQRSGIAGQPQVKTGRSPQEIIAWQQRTRGQTPNVG